MDPLISAEHLSRHYLRGTQSVRALDDVSFQIREGEFVAVVGPSGSGKSTLLNLLGCMDSPTSGTLRIAGQDLTSASEQLKVNFRRRQVGFVFQHFGLISTLSVEENIRLPHVFSRSAEHGSIEELLQKLALLPRRHHRPSELSGGEMQRVAIGRALYHKPKLLLADEPTGNLDSATAESILSLLKGLNSGGLTIIVVTHNTHLADSTSRRIQLIDGKIVLDSALASDESKRKRSCE
jgi:putative ABC transport system ATP-binding protein